MRVGSLFSGAGWLDQAVEEVLGAETAWHCEWDTAASKVLAHHWPDVPNYRDVTAVDWANVEPVDIICGGSPCQDVSLAGARGGMTEGTRSNLWVAMRDAIATIKPAFVIWENVSGARSATAASAMESDPGLLGDHPTGQPVLRALGRVLGDLAALGFNTEWRSLRASDVGACHGRERVFVLAWHPGRVNLQGHGAEGVEVSAASVGARVSGGTDRGDHGMTLLPTPAACNPNDGEGTASWLARRERVKLTSNNGNGMGMPLSIAVQLLPTPAANLGRCGGPQHPDKRRAGGHSVSIEDVAVNLLPTVMTRNNDNRQSEGFGPNLGTVLRANGTGWGEYAAAIHRAEQATGHPAPPPTELSTKGNPRLSPAFAEWMMMSNPGHVTDTPGISRNDQLKICGNGVVRPQAVAALRNMLATVLAESMGAVA